MIILADFVCFLYFSPFCYWWEHYLQQRFSKPDALANGIESSLQPDWQPHISNPFLTHRFLQLNYKYSAQRYWFELINLPGDALFPRVDSYTLIKISLNLLIAYKFKLNLSLQIMYDNTACPLIL